jgi:voltage-dependent potassium channel beta subunit
MGKTGLQLSILSLGSWAAFDKQIDEKTGDVIMGLAYDNGINFFDNAEEYAEGEGERMMGRVLKKKKWDRSTYTVSSKAFFGCHGKKAKPNQAGLSRKHLVEACNEALQRFQLEYLDLYLCHRADKNTPMEETVWAMNTLIQQGKILYWGTSEWSGVEIMNAHRVAQQYHLIGPSVEQPQYNLFERNKVENEFLPVYNTVGIGTTIWSPLASVFLTGKYNNGIPKGSRFAHENFTRLGKEWVIKDKIEKVKSLSGLAKKMGTNTTLLSIAWCLKNPNVTSAILGASDKKQLADNLKALEVMDLLTTEVMEEIDAIMQTKPKLPRF